MVSETIFTRGSAIASTHATLSSKARSMSRMARTSSTSHVRELTSAPARAKMGKLQSFLAR